MKKSRKHIALSTLLALLMLAVQTAFFPLHYYFTHHNTSLHAQLQYAHDQSYPLHYADSPKTTSFEDQGCFWCDLFAHQGYFLEKFSDFVFQCIYITPPHLLACIYTSLKSDLPDSRGPPACRMI